MEILKHEKTGAYTVEAEFKADGAEFEKALAAAYLKRKNSIAVPGFRKGKATRNMIERQYGENVFFEDAVNHMYGKIVSDVIEELKLDVVDTPDVEVLSINKADGVSFKARFTVKPEVTLTNYLGLEAKKEEAVVSEEDIDARLTRMRERGARIIDVTDRAVQEGDTVIFDFKGSQDGVFFEGGTAEKFSLEIGSGRFIPGFEAQVVGKNIGENFDVNVTFPEDYNAENLAGKEAVFNCYIHEIKGKELPELDEEFVKDVSEFDTLEELRRDLSEKILTEKQAEAEEAFSAEVSRLLAEKVDAEVPSAMFEHRIDDLVRDWEYRNRQQGITAKDYIRYANITEEQFRDMFRQPAEGHVKLRLALEKIAELEKLEISDEELDKEYEKLAEIYKMTVENVKSVISADTLRKDVIADKAFELVKENANGEKAAAKPAKKEKAAKAEKADKPEKSESAEKPKSRKKVKEEKEEKTEAQND